MAIVEAVTFVTDDMSPTVKRLTIAWQCAAGAATIVALTPDTAITAELLGWWAFMAVVNPGATAPTASYDVVLEDAAGADLFGGTLDANSATVSETWFPLLAGSTADGYPAYWGPRFISSAITFDIENNSVNAALGVVEVFFCRNRYVSL